MNSQNQLTKLDNGLTVVTEKFESSHTVSGGIWVTAGARYEDITHQGIAHFLEHLAFKGTKRRSAAQIAQEIEMVGGDVNAATGYETTSYTTFMLRDDLELGLDMIADICLNAVYDPQEIEIEKQVVMQEIAGSHDSPDDVIGDLSLEASFTDQPLGRPILGTIESVTNLQRPDLKGFLKQHYHPSNMTLALVGNVEHEHIVDQANKLYGSLKREETSRSEPARFASNSRLRHKELEQSHYFLGFEGYSQNHKDRYVAQVIAIILGGGMSSRLFQEIREKLGLCYSIYAYHFSLSDIGLFGIQAGTGNGSVVKMSDAICMELVKLCQSITPEELIKAKAQIKVSLTAVTETPRSRLGQMVSQTIAHGAPVSAVELMSEIDQIQLADVISVAQELFLRRNRSLACYGDFDRGFDRGNIDAFLG